MKNVQYIKISIIKTSGKMPKQQWPCSSQRTVLFKENRTSAPTKEDCFSCLGRFSNQKMHLNCQWKPGLSLAANTNVECFSGVTEPLLHNHAAYSTKVSHGSTSGIIYWIESDGVNYEVKAAQHAIKSDFMISGTTSLSLSWITISISALMRVPSRSVPHRKMKIYTSDFQKS